MSIASEITRLQTAKADLKTAIEGKGVTVSSSAKLDAYPALVESIQAGGGSGGDDWLYISIDGSVGMVNMRNVGITWDSAKINLEFSGSADMVPISWTSNTRVGMAPSFDLCQLRIKNIALEENETSTITIKSYFNTEITITIGYIGIRGDDYNDTTLKLVVVKPTWD